MAAAKNHFQLGSIFIKYLNRSETIPIRTYNFNYNFFGNVIIWVERKILRKFERVSRRGISSQTRPPTVIPVDIWDTFPALGGFPTFY